MDARGRVPCRSVRIPTRTCFPGGRRRVTALTISVPQEEML